MPRCSLEASSLARLFTALRCEAFGMLDLSSRQMFPGLAATCSLSVCLEPTYVLLVDFC